MVVFESAFWLYIGMEVRSLLNKIAIIGAGSWGTALSQVCIDSNIKEVSLLALREEAVNEIKEGKNEKFFPGVRFSKNIKASTNMKEVVSGADAIIFAVPSLYIADVLKEVISLIDTKPIFINVAKGFIPNTEWYLSSLFKKYNSQIEGFVSLIGPSHAEEVIQGKATTICSVSTNKAVADKIRDSLSNDYFRLYTLCDEKGAEIGAALKNTVAIASGMISEAGLGDNARAGIITRSLHEIKRFGEFFGAKPETFMGLTGIGDLIVTCSSVHSRNFRFGTEVIKLGSAEKANELNKSTVEGYRTCKVVYNIAQKNNISMPIFETVYKVLFEGVDWSIAMKEVMSRPYKYETK